MMFKPYPLGSGRIDDAALAEDKKSCRKIGPCGIGRRALYLNSFSSISVTSTWVPL